MCRAAIFRRSLRWVGPMISRAFWKISGVQIAGLVRLQAGDAVPVTQATNNNSSLGFAVQRPNRIGDPNTLQARSVAKYFDTSAFSTAPQFVIGSSSRNPVRGPGLQDADLMIGKTFPIREKVNLELRAEAFNVHEYPTAWRPQWKLCSDSAAFGSITSAGNPRVFELVGKVRF